jgi:hypothetical protein
MITFFSELDLAGSLFGPLQLNRGLRKIKGIAGKLEGTDHLTNHTYRTLCSINDDWQITHQTSRRFFHSRTFGIGDIHLSEAF